MALGTPVLLTSKEAGAETVTSDSFTPTAGRLLVVICGARRGAGNASAPCTVTDTAGTTFTLATDLNSENGTTSPSARQAVWVADVGASPAARTVTVGSVNASHITVIVIEVEDARWRSVNTVSHANNNGDPNPKPTVALNGLALYPATFAGVPTITTQPGANPLADVSGTNSRVVVRYSVGSIGTGFATWVSTGTRSVGAIIGLEDAPAVGEIDFAANLDTDFALNVAATRGVSEECVLDMAFAVATSALRSPERPASVWQGATRTWRMPQGTEPVAGSNLTFSGGTVATGPAVWAAYAGVNSPTGQLPNAGSLTATQTFVRDSGLKHVRMGMDGVGGKSDGASFNWTNRDSMVDGLLSAGIVIHCIIEPWRGVHINGPTEANWRYFVRNVLNRYSKTTPPKIYDYTIGNEPDGVTGITAAAIVDYTKWAVEERDALGLRGTVRIWAPPFKSSHHNYIDPATGTPGFYQQTMTAFAALADDKMPDGFDNHAYGPQVEDDMPHGEDFYEHDDIHRRVGMSRRPMIATECGQPRNTTGSWSLAGYPGGEVQNRINWLKQFYVQAKTFGYQRINLFDSMVEDNASGGDWRYVTRTSTTASTYTERAEFAGIKASGFGTPNTFGNGGFDTAEDGFGKWVVRQPVQDIPLWMGVNFFFDSTGGRTSAPCHRMVLGTGGSGTGRNSRRTLVTRQVADNLRVGARYTVTAWVNLAAGTTGRLRARGYDPLNCIAQVEASTTTSGSYQQLTVTTPAITNPWLVVELVAEGTTGTVRWDDVSVAEAGGYGYVAEINMYQWASGAPSVANFLMPVYINYPAMRSVAFGGRVQSNSGFDIRFETSGGVKVAHKLVTYDPVLGRCLALVNTPRNLGANEVLRCLIGNAGVTATEENPAGVLAGGWQAIYFGSGTEITGNGRDLAPGTAPGANSGISFYPALSFNGSTQYLRTSGTASWLNGVSELTVVSLHQPDTLGRKSEVFNIAAGANADLSLHFNDATTDRLTFVARFNSTVYQYQSADNTQGPIYDGQAVAVAAKAGEAIRMAIDGEIDTPGSGSGTITAGTTLNVTNPLEWGRGGRTGAATEYWSGELSFLAFCNVAQPNAVLGAMTAAFNMGGPGFVEDFVAIT